MILHNPTDIAVRDYPIQDPATNDVKLWTIRPGETLDFPEFAGVYLLQVYAFLQRVMTREEKDAEEKHQAEVRTGKHFSQVRILNPKEAAAQSVPKSDTVERSVQDNPNIRQDQPGGFTNPMMQQPAPAVTPVIDPRLKSEEAQRAEGYRGADAPQGPARAANQAQQTPVPPPVQAAVPGAPRDDAMTADSPPPPPPTGVQPPPGQNVGSFVCPSCNQAFATQGEVDSHYMGVHRGA